MPLSKDPSMHPHPRSEKCSLEFLLSFDPFRFDSFHCGGIIAGEGGGRKGGKWEWYVVSSSEINI